MIFDRAVRRMSNELPAYTLAVDKLDGWTAGSMPGTSAAGAMKLSAVNRCVECISDSISKLPVFVIDSKTKQHLNHPLLTLLERRPNEAMTPTVYKKLLEANRLLRGNSYAAILRSRSNARPVELLPLNSDCTYPQIDETGKLWYITINPRTGERRKINQWDMLHYKAFSSDGITGISVLSRAQEVIQTAQLAQRYESKLYSQNAQPTGVLTLDGDLGKEAKNKVREEWKNIHEGVDNAFRIAVLDLGMKYQPISMNNQDAQFVESKAVTVEDVARFFGVPLYKLMAGKQAYDFDGGGIMERINTTVLDKLGDNLDDMLKEAPEQRAELHRRVGEKIKEALDTNISGTISDSEGKVRGWQIVAVGSGGGYVAIRPKGFKDGGEVGPNGPGAITNYLSGGHAVRKPSGTAKHYTPRAKMLMVHGRKFYPSTDAQAQQIALAEAQKWADEIARDLTKGL